VIAQCRKLAALVSGVKNPLPAVLDGLGMGRTPYTMRLRTGDVVELRPGAGDLFGFYEIMLRRDYFASGQKLEAGNTVVDVGANIGCFTVLASKLVGPRGRVIAIEPEQSTYRQLLRNIALNKLSNVIPLNLAIGGSVGVITLHSDSNRLFSSIFSSVNGRAVEGTDQNIKMITLESLMNEHHIIRCDYLKLDCEGAEHEIIAGMSQTTADGIRQITMEVHKVPGSDPQLLKDRLHALGYSRIGTSTLPFYARQ
jgi:FkbM family methyltransferase